MGKDWTGNGKSIFTTLGASNHTEKEREINDYYATDPIAVDALIPYGGSTIATSKYLSGKSFMPAIQSML